MSLAGYTRLPTGEFTKNSDGSGPYAFDGTSMLLAATGTGGGGGGGGDASAANQTTQITAANLTNTNLGGVTETAPATDTASSGLNGRLQRIAQRLTSLIAQLPATLGIKTSALSLSVAPSSDGTFLVAGATATRTNQSGTIAAGGTAQTAIASNAARKGFEIQNQSAGNLYFSTLAAAVQSQPSILLVPGAFYETPLGGAGTGAVSIIGATTGQAYAAREWT